MVNTIPEQKLLNVRVHVEAQELYTVTGTVPLPSLPYGATPGSTFVVLQREADTVITPESLECQLLFNVVDVDPVSGEVRSKIVLLLFYPLPFLLLLFP